MRAKEILIEVTVQVDASEVNTPDKLTEKEKEIKRAIESIDPGIGIFTVENFL